MFCVIDKLHDKLLHRIKDYFKDMQVTSSLPKLIKDLHLMEIDRF